jgi:hypothetical protein
MSRTLGPAALLLVLGLAAGAAADEPRSPTPSKERGDAGKSVSPDASLFRREAPDKPWQFVKEGETLSSNDLLLGGYRSALESKNGAVRLDYLTDFSGTSPFPVIETAVVLHLNDHADLDFTLDRGRVDVINQKKEGPARVLCRFRGEVWDLTLAGPGTRVSVEVYGRWPRGAAFKKDPGPADVPLADLILLVLKGEAEVKVGGARHALQAPPGPAMLDWGSQTGLSPSPQRLDKLPDWAEPKPNDPEIEKRLAARKRMAELLKTKSIGETLDALLTSEDPAERRLGVLGAGALDDLERLARALSTTKYPDVWDYGVIALRHWIGRGPGQDQKLYHGLIEKRKMTPEQAETLIELLHGFNDETLNLPETYETLIEYLDKDELAFRGLAYWHLKRLVPGGEKFGYDPLGPKDKRDAAIAEWKKLIPAGKLPPRSAVKPGDK